MKHYMKPTAQSIALQMEGLCAGSDEFIIGGGTNQPALTREGDYDDTSWDEEEE